MRITETINTEVKGRQIVLINDGIAKLEDQDNGNGLANVEEHIRTQMVDGKTKGWTPYANFEASITWMVNEPSLGQMVHVTEFNNIGFIIEMGEEPNGEIWYKTDSDGVRAIDEFTPVLNHQSMITLIDKQGAHVAPSIQDRVNNYKF